VAAAESFGEGPVGEDAWAASGCLSRGRLASMAWVGKLRMRGELDMRDVFWEMCVLGHGQMWGSARIAWDFLGVDA
jgi:hypothetical protein